MSYLDYPRLHFSGGFQASPSTINNTPNNYNPLIYPEPNELQNVELYWNPKGDGAFALLDCVVTRVDYSDTESATSADQDPIIGQSVASVRQSSFPIDSAMVDLDPMQQNVSEIYALRLQVGGTGGNISGSLPNTVFNGIWLQAQGSTAPLSSASACAVFQAQIKEVTFNGDAGTSKFLQYFKNNPSAPLSVNFNTYCHNNDPLNYNFTPANFTIMEQQGVPATTLAKLKPLQTFFQNLGSDGKPANPGSIPTLDFVKYIMQQFLNTEEYNQCIDTVLSVTKQTDYVGSTTQPFTQGLLTGTVGAGSVIAPTYFVPSRVMAPYDMQHQYCYFAPFTIDANNVLTLNLGNSLPTEVPGSTPYADLLGDLELVSFTKRDTSAANATSIAPIEYSEEMITNQAGFVTMKLTGDYSSVPLGIKSSAKGIVLAEDPNGYSMRADQFVFRMNPGVSGASVPRGDTATVSIYVNEFGQAVPDGTEVVMSMMTPGEALTYTSQTPGTGGTRGIENVSIPQDALKMAGGAINGGKWQASATTTNGVATFTLTCTDPGNPRMYVDGQVYFLNYNFGDASIKSTYTQDPNDIISVQVYSQKTEAEAVDVLKKFGMLYKIMAFLTDEQQVEQIDMRNMIKLLLERPYDQIQHMPLTRDMSDSARDKIVDWINTLNQS